MKFKLIALISTLGIFLSISYKANAQYLTSDLLFLKVGYIPQYIVNLDIGTTEEDINHNGLAVQGEYNINLNNFLLAFGLEYQWIRSNDYAEDIDFSFIQPMVCAKLATRGGLYLGAGVSGKYLISIDSWQEAGSKYEYTKKIDLWANAVIGYYLTLGEGIFLDLEGRFGFNLTNQQFSEIEINGTTDDNLYEPGYAYDIAFYIGIGTRARASEF